MRAPLLSVLVLVIGGGSGCGADTAFGDQADAAPAAGDGGDRGRGGGDGGIGGDGDVGGCPDGCAQAPPAECDGTCGRVVYAAPGRCVAGRCQFPSVREDCRHGCDLATGACALGPEQGPCAAPRPSCVADPKFGTIACQRVVYDSTGECVAGACAIAARDESCAFGCDPDRGACRAASEFCAGLVCGSLHACGSTCAPGSGCCPEDCASAPPPPARCAEDDPCARIVPQPGGACRDGACAFPESREACGFGCDPATGGCRDAPPYCDGRTCGDGHACGGVCEPGSGCCEQDCAVAAPPAPDCAPGGCDRRVYAAPGACVTGRCEHPASVETCAFGCEAGACRPASAFCAGQACGARYGCGGCCAEGSGCAPPTYTVRSDAHGQTICCDPGDSLTRIDDCGSGRNHWVVQDGNCGTAYEGSANYGSPCVLLTCADPGCG